MTSTDGDEEEPSIRLPAAARDSLRSGADDSVGQPEVNETLSPNGDRPAGDDRPAWFKIAKSSVGGVLWKVQSWGRYVEAIQDDALLDITASDFPDPALKALQNVRDRAAKWQTGMAVIFGVFITSIGLGSVKDTVFTFEDADLRMLFAGGLVLAFALGMLGLFSVVRAASGAARAEHNRGSIRRRQQHVRAAKADLVKLGGVPDDELERKAAQLAAARQAVIRARAAALDIRTSLRFLAGGLAIYVVQVALTWAAGSAYAGGPTEFFRDIFHSS